MSGWSVSGVPTKVDVDIFDVTRTTFDQRLSRLPSKSATILCIDVQLPTPLMTVSGLDTGDSAASERRDARKRKLYESLREREFYAYYESVLAYANTEPKYCDLHSPEIVAEHQAVASADATLTALAQLVALRTSARRALISFLDAEYSYIIAESTQTLSLQDDDEHSKHDPDDSLWLGFTKIPRGSSLWEGTADLPLNEGSNAQDPHSASVAHIVNDLAEDSHFRDKPYVKGGPKARFYAGVPITTPRGIVIGVLCVLDDKPRDGLEPSQVAFLQSMASTVVSHLELVS